MASAPFDDRDGFIWMDGRTVPWRDAKIHVLSHGLHYASCVFEGERAYGGVIFKSLEHTIRLFKSAAILGMEIPFSVEAIEAAKRDLLVSSGLSEAYIRPVVWRGSEQMGVSAPGALPHVAIACWQWPSYFSPEKLEKGIALKTSIWRKPAADTAPVHAKASGLYMIGTMSKHAVEKEGFDDALMLDYRGHVAEATGANLFAVRDGALYTPVPDCFLNGITRQTVIEIAHGLGIPVTETTIMPGDLPSYSEIFVTGTAAEVTAVGRIDDHVFTVGPVTRRLRSAYSDLVNGRNDVRKAG